MKLKNFDVLMKAIQDFQKNADKFGLSKFDIKVIIHSDLSYYIELEFVGGNGSGLSIVIAPDENISIINWVCADERLDLTRKACILGWVISNYEIF
jgi:hypothetical protein